MMRLLVAAFRAMDVEEVGSLGGGECLTLLQRTHDMVGDQLPDPERVVSLAKEKSTVGDGRISLNTLVYAVQKILAEDEDSARAL